MQMENIDFNNLLLKTAFSCMACDGSIDKREVLLIKKLHNEKKIFGDIEIDQKLEDLLLAINSEGIKFLRDCFTELSSSLLSTEQELQVIEVAIDTISADEKIEYSEIKFFKVIRSKLRISNDSILMKRPEFEEYLEEDIISESYLSKLQNDFFDSQSIPVFELNSLLDDFKIDKED